MQGTKGAELHSELNLPVGSLVIRKGADRRIEARSAFTESKLLETLQRFSIERVYICGVPTELTVLETALEANSLGFTTFAVEDGIAALTQDAAEVAGAIEKMKDAGIELISRDELAGEARSLPSKYFLTIQRKARSTGKTHLADTRKKERPGQAGPGVLN